MMKLGIYFSLGSSLEDLKKIGQDKRFYSYYLKNYKIFFKKVFIFSYKNEKHQLPKNCILISNKYSLNRFLYSFLIPFLHIKKIKKVNLFRVLQFTGALPAIITRIIFKKPFLATYGYDYSAFARLDGYKVKSYFLKILEILVMKFCNGVIVTTKENIKILSSNYPETKLFYISNGVDVNKFKMQNVKCKNTKQNSKFIKLLFVGRLEGQKNLLNLVKGVSMQKNRSKIRLTFVGQGRLHSKLIKKASDLKVNLRIIKRVNYNSMPQVYNQADIFTFPSYLEGQPKALLEAMACGLPCLVGNYPGVKDEFENYKEILVADFNAQSIAKNLDNLIRNKNLQDKLSVNARKRVEKDFDINKIIKQEIKVLKSLSNV